MEVINTLYMILYRILDQAYHFNKIIQKKIMLDYLLVKKNEFLRY